MFAIRFFTSVNVMRDAIRHDYVCQVTTFDHGDSVMLECRRAELIDAAGEVLDLLGSCVVMEDFTVADITLDDTTMLSVLMEDSCRDCEIRGTMVFVDTDGDLADSPWYWDTYNDLCKYFKPVEAISTLDPDYAVMNVCRDLGAKYICDYMLPSDIIHFIFRFRQGQQLSQRLHLS